MKLSRAVKPDPTALCEIRSLSDQVRRYFSDGLFASPRKQINPADFSTGFISVTLWCTFLTATRLTQSCYYERAVKKTVPRKITKAIAMGMLDTSSFLIFDISFQRVEIIKRCDG